MTKDNTLITNKINTANNNAQAGTKELTQNLDFSPIYKEYKKLAMVTGLISLVVTGIFSSLVRSW